MTDKKSSKSTEIYNCTYCNYSTCRKSQYDRHISTPKHKKMCEILTNTDAEPSKKFICECGNIYKHRQSLFTHKKNCNIEKIYVEDLTDKELIMILIKENSELKNMVLEVVEKIQPLNNIVNSQNVNSNNKTFNLNVFLNEQCKDAMNITDFVDSVKLQLSDLESVGKLGFVEGISNIIVKNLKALDIHKRPVHCSDSKREVMYVKDENKWEKENEEKNHLRKAIKYIAHKNSKILPEFKAKYPDCGKSDSKYADHYNKLVIEAMGGRGDNDYEKEDKIIRNIAKKVVIEK